MWNSLWNGNGARNIGRVVLVLAAVWVLFIGMGIYYAHKYGHTHTVTPNGRLVERTPVREDAPRVEETRKPARTERAQLGRGEVDTTQPRQRIEIDVTLNGECRIGVDVPADPALRREVIRQRTQLGVGICSE